MLEWIDRDSFRLENHLGIYNYNNLVSIGVYTFSDENKVKLQIKQTNGEKITLYSCDTSNDNKTKEIRESFNKFIKSRPGNTSPNKIKIK